MSQNQRLAKNVGLLLSIGAGLGGAIGMAVNNASLGVAIGVGIGGAISLMLNWFRDKSDGANGENRK
jgi:cyanate permease